MGRKCRAETISKRSQALLYVTQTTSLSTSLTHAGVCRDEKSARDECFLFSDKGGETECIDKIDAYKKCMAGFGFKI